jgi:hypothetical protein
MQKRDADELRKRWMGGPCSHPEIEKEYDLGISTGDYVCTRCGKAGWGNDWNEKKQENSKNTNGNRQGTQ